MGVVCVQQWTEDNGLMTNLKLTGNLMASDYRRLFLPQIVQYRSNVDASLATWSGGESCGRNIAYGHFMLQ